MKQIFFIIITFFIAALLTILPLPHWLEWIWPEWLVLILLYWNLIAPNRVSVGIAFLIGILADLLRGNVLGENALLMVLLVYFINRFYPRMRSSPVWQQVFIVFFMVLIYLLLRLWLQDILAQVSIHWSYFLSALTSALLWPAIYLVLNRYQKHRRSNRF